VNLTDTQSAALRRIADGSCDRTGTPSSAFSRGRDDARSRLAGVLDHGTGDAFEEAAIEMDADAAFRTDGDDYGQGWLSVLADVRRVLPSWPWLPETPDPEGR
jgi:hypothetical protein